jgi:predicted secreted protein with PEFG-CTERM motif
MKSKPMGALLGVLALVAIIAIAPQAFAATAQVTISKGASVTNGTCSATSCFDPNVINVNVGDTVTWSNADTVGHTATSGKPTDNQTGTVWDSSLIKAGGSYTSPAFTTAGTYNYFCMVHPWMTAQVIVGAGSATSSPTTTAPSGNNMTGMNMAGNSTMSGNQTVPEFGPVASLVLVIAIISVIAFTAKTRGLPKL